MSFYLIRNIFFLQDFRKDLNRLITQKVMLDRVSQENCRESELATHNFDKLSIDIPGKDFVRSLKCLDPILFVKL